MDNTPLTDEEKLMLKSLEYWHRKNDKGARPLDLGGRNGSGHSYILNKLVKRGLVSRTRRNPLGTRGAYRYALTEAGREAVEPLTYRR